MSETLSPDSEFNIFARPALACHLAGWGSANSYRSGSTSCLTYTGHDIVV